MLKPKLTSPLEKNMEVGSDVEGMSIGMLGILMNGKDDTTNIPQIKGPKYNGMDGVGPMEIRGGNVDITGILPKEFPLGPLEGGLIWRATLDETIGLDMVGESIKK